LRFAQRPSSGAEGASDDFGLARFTGPAQRPAGKTAAEM